MKTRDTSLTQGLVNALRYWVRGRKDVVFLADRNVSLLLTLARLFSLGILLTGLYPPNAAAHSLEELEERLKGRERYAQIVNHPAPEFRLRGLDGEAVSLADLRGKVVILWFVYTRCPDVCPLHSEALASIQEQVNQTPMRELVQFITITTDPEHDTPIVLQDYGPNHGLDPINWTVLTSGPEEPSVTREVAEKFGLKFTLGEDGYQMHGVVTHLIDKSGNLRARYHGLRFHPTNLIVHINALSNDYH
jgi:protein SCO1/2